MSYYRQAKVRIHDHGLQASMSMKECQSSALWTRIQDCNQDTASPARGSYYAKKCLKDLGGTFTNFMKSLGGLAAVNTELISAYFLHSEFWESCPSIYNPTSSMSSNFFNNEFKTQSQTHQWPPIAHCIVYRTHVLSLEGYVQDHWLITSSNGGFIRVDGASISPRRPHPAVESTRKD